MSAAHGATRTLLWLLAGTIVLATLAMLTIVGAGWSPRVEYVLALAVVAAVVTTAVRRSTRVLAAPIWTLAEPIGSERPGVDPRIATIETVLRRGVEDAGMCRRRVQPLLFDLATHRLRRDRNIELIEDPDTARELLGDEVFHFLTDVVDRPASPALIRTTVAAIERL